MAKTEKKHIRKKRGYSIEQAARFLKRWLKKTNRNGKYPISRTNKIFKDVFEYRR